MARPTAVTIRRAWSILVGAGAALALASGSGASAGAHRITAAESEYKIVLSSSSVTPGTYLFVAVNKGHIPHSLAVSGPGITRKRIAGTIAPGSSKTMSVSLKKGSYAVYCPIDGHRALGMNTKVTVR